MSNVARFLSRSPRGTLKSIYSYSPPFSDLHHEANAASGPDDVEQWRKMELLLAWLLSQAWREQIRGDTV